MPRKKKGPRPPAPVQPPPVPAPPRPPAAMRAPVAPPSVRPPLSPRFFELMAEPTDIVTVWLERLIQWRDFETTDVVSQFWVTQGPRCPRCSGPSRFRTMTETEREVTEAVVERVTTLGPMAGRKCTSDRCGIAFLEISTWSKP